MNEKRPWWLAIGESIVEHIEAEQRTKQRAAPGDLASDRPAGAEPLSDPQPQFTVPPAAPQSPNNSEDGQEEGRASTPVQGEVGGSSTLAGRSAASSGNPAIGVTTGPKTCSNCRHYRSAHEPLSKQVLSLMPTRTMANSRVIQDVQREESMQIAEEVNALPAVIDTAVQMANAVDAPASSRHSSRPLIHDYCGEHEMELRYELVQIKNLDGNCEHYDPNKITARSCDTCANLETPPTELVSLIQKPFTKAGPAAMKLYTDSVQEPLKLRADMELAEVIRRQGLLTTKPAHFAHCQHFSRPETGYVIGPLVNQGRQCEAWRAKTDETQRSWEPALQLMESIQHKLDTFQANAPKGPAVRNVSYLIQKQVNAFEQNIRDVEVEFIREALKGMGFEHSEAENIAGQLAFAQEAHRMNPGR